MPGLIALKDWAESALDRFPALKAAWARFGDKLQTDTDRPLLVGVSGGGDSVALLLLLWLWGQRRLIVANVDHGLQVQSPQWAQGVADLCARLGVEYRGLKWTNPASGAGLARAARLARHRLLAEAAREAKANVICFGHNRDDALEAAWMREQGSNVGSARLWAPSPVWPEGRDVFVYRPLINIDRKTLRDWLKACGVDYIDDPANANPKSLRARARIALNLGDGAEPPEVGSLEPALITQDDYAALPFTPEVYESFGAISLNRQVFVNLPPENGRKILAAALVAAGGREGLIDAARLRAAYDGVISLERSKRTLAGARMLLTDEQILLCRDATDRRRGPLEAVNLNAGETTVWDGRFEIKALKNLTIMPNEGAGLMRSNAVTLVVRARLKTLPPEVRQGVPLGQVDASQGALNPFAVWEDGGATEDGLMRVRALSARRFRSAIGIVAREADLQAAERND